MSVKFKPAQIAMPASPNYGRWYAKMVPTATYADTLAVLNELSVALRRHLLNSDRVEIDGIGAFKVGLSTAPANTSADFGAQNIKSFHVNYQPFKRFVGNGQVTEKNRRKGTFVYDLIDGVTAKEAAKNAIDATPADDSND